MVWRKLWPLNFEKLNQIGIAEKALKDWWIKVVIIGVTRQLRREVEWIGAISKKKEKNIHSQIVRNLSDRDFLKIFWWRSL